MSTNRQAYPHNQLSRGAAEFDAVALRRTLAGAAELSPVDPAALTNYRAFYGLEFAATPHHHEMYCLAAAGERLVVQHFVPAEVQGYVLLCHGYYDHVGLFTHTLEYLLDRGLGVVTYDQIGHGLSSGAPAVIDSFDRYVAATHAVYTTARGRLNSGGTGDTRPWHWLGQSMGGAIVKEYLQQQPPAEGVGEIVLFAPLVRPHAWWFNRWVFALAKLAITERPRTLADNAENPEFHALQKIDPLQPRVLPVAWVQAMVDWNKRFERYPVSTLAPKLIQGDADRTVDWRYNLKVFEQRYPDASTLLIAGGRHHLANESDRIRQQIWTFLDDNCLWRS